MTKTTGIKPNISEIPPTLILEKAEFVTHKLEEYSKDGAKFWREIKNIYPSNKSKTTRTKIKLTDQTNSQTVPDDETANFINEFFINVGNSTDNVGNISSKPNKRCKQPRCAKKVTPQSHKWSLGNFSEGETLETIKSIETNKSSGLTNINNKILKPVLKILLPQITHVFNTSVAPATFPDSWKQALVVPIPKIGDPTKVANYRPISQPGKIMEKKVYQKLMSYIEKRFTYSQTYNMILGKINPP